MIALKQYPAQTDCLEQQTERLFFTKKNASNTKAFLDIVGRDQQDQRLHLEFNKNHLIWEFIKSETELWSLPDDPLLDKDISNCKCRACEWVGTATEVIKQLDLDIQPNSLTRHLNVNADRLWSEYNISYECKRNRDCRQIIFNYSQPSLE